MLWCERNMSEIKPGGKQIQAGIDIPGNIVSAVWSNCAWIHYVWAFLYTGQQITIFECTITFLYLQLNASTWEKKLSGFPALFTMLSFKEGRGNFVAIKMAAPPLCGHPCVSPLLPSLFPPITYIHVFGFVMWSTVIIQLLHIHLCVSFLFTFDKAMIVVY